MTLLAHLRSVQDCVPRPSISTIFHEMSMTEVGYTAALCAEGIMPTALHAGQTADKGTVPNDEMNERKADTAGGNAEFSAAEQKRS